MTETKEAAATASQEVIANSLSQLAYSFNGVPSMFGGYGAQLSQTDTLRVNNRWYLISNDRQLLNEIYVEHGIIQTLVDQPVDDAFRSGIEVRSNQLSIEQLEELLNYCEANNVIAEVQQAIKWARLFGGGAVVFISDEDPATPLNIERINKKTRIAFRGVDMWELYDPQYNSANDQALQVKDPYSQTFDYYGMKVHKSRVFGIKGKQPPSMIRPRLRGWGMSEIERLIRSMNQYLKNQDVIFELLDEAKIDIYKIKGLNTALATISGTGKISQRLQHANTIKNYNNAITMDLEDEYEQKQMNFTGLADMLTQIRQGIAADLKMPVTKLFGISAAGFNSGEDDIENYNSMVEGEVRAKVKFIVIDVLKIVCQHLFDMTPTDLTIAFKPLRILSAEQEEKVKAEKWKRVMDAADKGIADAKETKMAINKDGLLPVELNEETDFITMDDEDDPEADGDDGSDER